MNIPPRGKSTGRKPKYNFHLIAMGASQYYEDRRARQAAATYTIHQRTKGIEVKFTARVTGDGITIYRTK